MGSKKSLKFIKRIFLIAIAVMVIKFLIPVTPYKTILNNNPIQGVWMTHIGTSFLSYTTLLDNSFRQLSRLNFNRVYVDVYNGGVIYPSQYAPRNYQVSLPFTDPLKAAIKEGKRHNLDIYAWYEHGMMMFPDDQLAQAHPDWLLKTANNETFIENHVWLDPDNPEVATYFTNLFLEVVANYPDLKGIQLDDHWGIPQVFGNKVSGMNALTNQVFTAIKQARPDLIISLSPNPYNFAYNNYSQDWLLWIKQGLIDEAIVQIYRTTTQQVTDTLINSGLKTAQQYIPVAVGIYTGNIRVSKSLTELQSQISAVKQSNYGYALFCWENLFTPLKRGTKNSKEAIFQLS